MTTGIDSLESTEVPALSALFASRSPTNKLPSANFPAQFSVSQSIVWRCLYVPSHFRARPRVLDTAPVRAGTDVKRTTRFDVSDVLPEVAVI
jgi:hypothetical protein